MIKRMTSVGVIRKQEDYRERTISEVAEMKAEYPKDKIAEEVGVSGHEAASLMRIVERRLKEKQRRVPQIQPIERRFF
jgi:hypothetical protein